MKSQINKHPQIWWGKDLDLGRIGLLPSGTHRSGAVTGCYSSLRRDTVGDTDSVLGLHNGQGRSCELWPTPAGPPCRARLDLDVVSYSHCTLTASQINRFLLASLFDINTERIHGQVVIVFLLITSRSTNTPLPTQSRVWYSTEIETLVQLIDDRDLSGVFQR